MTTPENVLAFYAEAHWGSLYGVTDTFHLTPHKGLDCGLFHGIVDVPALHGGTVAAAAASTSVGHYVTVLRPDGQFDTYCHIVIGVKVGETVNQGDRLGRQAVTQAEGGVAWRGQHTHLCLSRTRDGWATWGYNNLDPTPGVISVLTSAAGGGGQPITNQEDDNMKCYERGVNTGQFALGASGVWYLFKSDEAGGDANARGILNQAFGEIIQQQPADFDTVGKLYLAAKPASSPTDGSFPADYYSDADAARDAAAIAAQITALKAILNKGLTISGTAAPAK